MAILRRKPTSEIVSLRDAMNRLVDDSIYLPQAFMDLMNGDAPILLDMYEENNSIVVKASLPGLKPEELSIEVQDNVLTISGKTKEEANHKEGDYLLNERRSGHFRRSVTLPCDVKVEQAEAEFEDGILTLTLPKSGTIPVKKIAVKPKTKAEKSKAQSAKAETATI